MLEVEQVHQVELGELLAVIRNRDGSLTLFQTVRVSEQAHARHSP
jgi:hypothetical protein